jgi:hypothetical protein
MCCSKYASKQHKNEQRRSLESTATSTAGRMTESFKYLTDQVTFIFIIEQCHDPIELYSLQA